MPELPERTALYRLYDKAGALLYIGITNDPGFRWKAHLYSGKTWPKQAARTEIEWHDSRAAALKAEPEAIKAERPRHNGKHNYDDAAFDPATWPRVTASQKAPAIAELMRTEITSGRWALGQRIPSLRTIGEAVGAHMRIVGKATAMLRQEGLIKFRPGHGVFVGETETPIEEALRQASPPPERSSGWLGPRIVLTHDWYRQNGFPE